MVIDISINYDLFLRIIFMLYVITSLGNLLNGVFKTEKNIKPNNGWIEVAAGILMFIIVAISILY